MCSTGIFAEWQPRYAEQGIATFPVVGKKPAVRGYQSLGLRASNALATRFSAAGAFGLALKRAGIVVVDVDTTDERVLIEALERHGPSPFVVRSGSGHFQAWYRRQNERRLIRPDTDRPIDILGQGYVVAPPSRGERGSYQMIQGTLDDLARLPGLRNAVDVTEAPQGAVGTGKRNETLWRHCMAEAIYTDDFDALLDVARTHNYEFSPPLSDAEVAKTARSAWDMTVQGKNWFGSGERVVTTFDEIDGLMRDHPDAFLLLTMLRRHHSIGTFVVANAMAGIMSSGGWARKRFATARQVLIDIGELVQVRPASKATGPALFRFKGGRI